MPVDPNAAIEITAFGWVPPFAQGQVRDLRVRWALEEAGLPYNPQLFDAREQRPPAYLREQPFDQVPVFREGGLTLFETGAILLHIAERDGGERDERLLPADPAGRARAIQWMFAALNSVEPALQNLTSIDLFHAGEEWAKLRRPGAEQFARLKLKRVADWLGEREWLEDRFTVGDLLMTTVLRVVDHTELVAEQPALARYKARGEGRPAFTRALRAQMADYTTNAPDMAA